jgi:tyrosyl-tRNA synthetase
LPHMAKLKADLEVKIEHLLTRNVEQVTVKNHLEAALRSGKKLRVKLGIDPTGDKIHIGRAVALWKLKEFQDLGHKIILIIGDFTAQIGDASDKLAKRPMLEKEQIKKNLKTYLPQIGKILNLKKTEVRYNSEWLGKLRFQDVLGLADLFTAQQMIERRNFSERWEKHEEISLREFLYPLMQGYDSVAIKADVELGGTDQLFNLMAGRKIQERFKQKPQDIMLTGMLSGTDGRKMSTSWGNVINIVDAPDEQFGKAMAIHDSEIVNYFRTATDLDDFSISKYELDLKNGKNPKDVKLALANALVTRYHGEKAADKAQAKWDSLFSKKEISTSDIPELKVSKGITAQDVVVKSGVTQSKGEAWRLVSQGGLRVNDQIVPDPKEKLDLAKGDVVKVGKKRFFRIG